MRYIYLFYISFTVFLFGDVPPSNEIVTLHSVTTSEMNAINNPQEGSLVFNSDNKEVYEYNGTTWKRISSDGNETKIIAGNGLSIIGSGTALDPYVIHLTVPNGCSQNASIYKTCKSVTSAVDGIYCIDPDGTGGETPYEVYCDMTHDGGGWTLVFRHDVSGGFFLHNGEADSFNIASPGLNTKKYSILNKIDSLKSGAKYEFRLYYPNEAIRNHWKQSFDPRSGPSPTRPVLGYEAITVNATGSYWGGLERSTASTTFLDGSVNHGNWWFAIGTNGPYSTGIPGPSRVVDIVELYIR